MKAEKMYSLDPHGFYNEANLRKKGCGDEFLRQLNQNPVVK